MKKNITALIIFTLGVLALKAQHTDIYSNVDNFNLEKIIETEKERRLEIIRQVDEYKKEASVLISEKRFDEANETLEKAESILNDKMTGPRADLQIKKLDNFISQFKRSWAVNLEDDAKKMIIEAQQSDDFDTKKQMYDKAAKTAKKAISIYPDLSERLGKIVEKCNKRIGYVDYREATKLEKFVPDNNLRKRNISVYLKQAQILYDNKKYMNARDKLEQVLVRDAYNQDAILLLDKIYRKLHKIAAMRSKAEWVERIAEVKWKWSQPVLPTENILSEDTKIISETPRQNDIYDKMQNIVFDEINFKNANIKDVITALRVRSKELDTPTNKGINIVLKSDTEKSSVPKVTLSLNNIPLFDLLTYICQLTGLKFRPEGGTVLIGRSGINPMRTKFFPVSVQLIEGIGVNIEDTGGTSGTDDLADLMGQMVDDGGDDEGRTTGINANSPELKSYFEARGVPFPEGTAIAYSHRAGRLIVKNTEENLRKLDMLLRQLNITIPQVLIEAKVIEMKQTDLEELGFHWTFWDRGGPESGWLDNSVIPPEITNADIAPLVNSAGDMLSNEDFEIPKTDDILRGNTADVGSALINNLLVMPNANYDSNLALTVNALDRCEKAEILSAPKILAKSGEEAIIQMVRMEYFPDTWNEPDLVITDSAFEFTMAEPELGDATPIGITLTVTPQVSPNKNTIILDIAPEIIERVGWSDYNYVVVTPQETATASAGSFVLKMPEISHRDVVTRVKVYNNETIVLGGMLQEENDMIDDKIPLLGDLPLVGRAFRSVSENSEKKDLLIVITARIMNYDGIPAEPYKGKGIPDFNRI